MEVIQMNSNIVFAKIQISLSRIKEISFFAGRENVKLLRDMVSSYLKARDVKKC